jgi:hypothetical protein
VRRLEKNMLRKVAEFERYLKNEKKKRLWTKNESCYHGRGGIFASASEKLTNRTAIVSNLFQAGE